MNKNKTVSISLLLVLIFINTGPVCRKASKLYRIIRKAGKRAGITAEIRNTGFKIINFRH